MKVDYHVHPNLRGENTSRRLKAIWKALHQKHIDAIVCAEHTFKDAPAAYRALTAARPGNARTHVFPGAELVAKDCRGIDVIAFAEHDWYAEHPRLLEPYAMTLREMLCYLKNSDLHYFIPHPLAVGSTLPGLFPTDAEMQSFLESVPAFEAFNASFLLLEHLFQYPLLRPLLKRFRHRLRTGASVDLQRYQKPTHTFLAVGSDAHHPWEIGFCLEIPSDGTESRHEVFQKLTTNTVLNTLHFPRFKWIISRLLAMAWTTSCEGLMRRELRRELKDQQSFCDDSLALHTEFPS